MSGKVLIILVNIKVVIKTRIKKNFLSPNHLKLLSKKHLTRNKFKRLLYCRKVGNKGCANHLMIRLAT